MKRKLSTFWAVLLIAMLAISPAAAGGVGVHWGQGSIIVDGEGWGFARGLVQVIAGAEGFPVVTCTLDGNSVPGDPQSKNSVVVSTIVPVDRNGHFLFDMEGVPDFSDWSPTKLGCPNDDYTAHVDWVNWIHTSITVKDQSGGPNTGKVLFFRAYNCISTEKSVDCQPIKKNG